MKRRISHTVTTPPLSNVVAKWAMQKRGRHEKCVVSIPTSKGGDPNHCVLQIIELTSTAIDRLISGEGTREGQTVFAIAITVTKGKPVGSRGDDDTITYQHQITAHGEQGKDNIWIVADDSATSMVQACG